ncbi:MAG: FAS1-like dehydratase domain-containing protein [Janthinobacterium lividum]
MAIDSQKLQDWPFPVMTRHYTEDEAIRVAKGFGAGIPGALSEQEAPFMSGRLAFPMMALALADGEFWQSDPASGIDWKRIVHAEEMLTLHRPLPSQGTVTVMQRVAGVYDRGPERGAVMVQNQFLNDADGALIARIDVTTILKGDGGFGGKPYVTPEKVSIPEERATDAQVSLRTPGNNDDALYRLSADLAVAAHLPPGKAMLRGLGALGLAGRAVMALVCPGAPERLRRLGVRYTGALLTDEAVRLDLWRVAPGRAVFRLVAPERDVIVLNGGQVEFAAQA